MTALYDIEVERASGARYRLDELRGHVLLVTNTASRCGFTPQYAALERLHQRFHARGLRVLGFPCNQFGRQEPGGTDEIQSFCAVNYGVTFPVHTKIEVNGRGAHPLFQHLCREAPGLLGTRAIKWNFTKFLVDRSGRAIERFAPRTDPEDLVPSIERLLAQGAQPPAP